MINLIMSLQPINVLWRHCWSVGVCYSHQRHSKNSCPNWPAILLKSISATLTKFSIKRFVSFLSYYVYFSWKSEQSRFLEYLPAQLLSVHVVHLSLECKASYKYNIRINKLLFPIYTVSDGNMAEEAGPWSFK